MSYPDCDTCGGEGVVGGLIVGDEEVEEVCPACRKRTRAEVDGHPTSYREVLESALPGPCDHPEERLVTHPSGVVICRGCGATFQPVGRTVIYAPDDDLPGPGPDRIGPVLTLTNAALSEGGPGTIVGATLIDTETGQRETFGSDFSIVHGTFSIPERRLVFELRVRVSVSQATADALPGLPIEVDANGVDVTPGVSGLDLALGGALAQAQDAVLEELRRQGLDVLNYLGPLAPDGDVAPLGGYTPGFPMEVF